MDESGLGIDFWMTSPTKDQVFALPFDHQDVVSPGFEQVAHRPKLDPLEIKHPETLELGPVILARARNRQLRQIHRDLRADEGVRLVRVRAAFDPGNQASALDAPIQHVQRYPSAVAAHQPRIVAQDFVPGTGIRVDLDPTLDAIDPGDTPEGDRPCGRVQSGSG